MKEMSVLLVDDDERFRERVAGRLQGTENEILPDTEIALHFADSQKSAEDKLTEREKNGKASYDVAIVDLWLRRDEKCVPDSDTRGGVTVLRDIKRKCPSTIVVLVTKDQGASSINTAVEAITRYNAFHYLFKHDGSSFFEQLLLELRLASQYIKFEQASIKTEGIVGEHPKLMHVLELVRKVAPTNSDVLILGENGTGKELIAEAVHNRSRRKDGPFIRMNCAAIHEELALSELFGHEKGAFTGATKQRIGKFELANGGTLFLDEVGDLSSGTQAKILRALDNKEIERVGGNKTINVDVRIVAATNKDLEKEVMAGRFRMDLYHRLKVFDIEIPPLRERKSDIPLLANYFIKQYDQYDIDSEKELRTTDESLKCLKSYEWPGNVRELKHAIAKAAILCEDGVIRPEHFPGIYESLEKPGITYSPQQLISNIQDTIADSDWQERFDRLHNTHQFILAVIFREIYEEGNTNKITSRLLEKWSLYKHTTCSTALTELMKRGFLSMFQPGGPSTIYYQLNTEIFGR